MPVHIQREMVCFNPLTFVSFISTSKCCPIVAALVKQNIMPSSVIAKTLLFLLMKRDYVSELRPPTGLLFIPQVM
jgi:hypothetical protein